MSIHLYYNTCTCTNVHVCKCTCTMYVYNVHVYVHVHVHVYMYMLYADGYWFMLHMQCHTPSLASLYMTLYKYIVHVHCTCTLYKYIHVHVHVYIAHIIRSTKLYYVHVRIHALKYESNTTNGPRHIILSSMCLDKEKTTSLSIG